MLNAHLITRCPLCGRIGCAMLADWQVHTKEGSDMNSLESKIQYLMDLEEINM